MGKNPFSFSRSSSRKRRSKPKRDAQSKLLQTIGAITSSSAPPSISSNSGGGVVGLLVKTKKKATGTRLWMRFDRMGASELVEYDKSAIIQKASLPARDLRILGPVFSNSCTIVAREKAMIVNLEFVKAIVTAEEILIPDPLQQEVLQFVDQLIQWLPHKSALKTQGTGTKDASESEMHVSTPFPKTMEGLQCELPFEFQVLEIALEVVCSSLEKKVVGLETDAYPVLDELARNVSTKNLEHVRSLKSNLTHILARVQKVRDEIEHLLDDNEDMANLYLTRKWLHNLQMEALSRDEFSINIGNHPPRLRRLGSNKSGSMMSHYFDDNNVEDLEMLLEAYFMRLDGMRNKILSVREYIDDTEDYVNIQLDNHRNELIELQLTLTIFSFSLSIETLISGWFGMNIPCTLYKKDGIFEIFVAGITGLSLLIFLIILGYARWTKLIGS
ncbi:hypothetical protein GQ457_18G016800 [Hibiscus cannabinus]